VRLPQADDICTVLTVKNLRPRLPLRSEGAMCPAGTCYFVPQKDHLFLVRLPQADDICMAITVKNLRPRLPLRTEGDVCPPGKYHFVSQKAHLFLCVYRKQMIFVRRSRSRTCVPGCHSALRAICAHQANIILYPKRNIFFGAFTASR
jgi:hypothetical protein